MDLAVAADSPRLCWAGAIAGESCKANTRPRFVGEFEITLRISAVGLAAPASQLAHVSALPRIDQGNPVKVSDRMTRPNPRNTRQNCSATRNIAEREPSYPTMFTCANVG